MITIIAKKTTMVVANKTTDVVVVTQKGPKGDPGSGGSGSGTFVGLSDTPVDFTGAGGKAVQVNPTATGLEFVPSTSGGDMSTAVYDTNNNGRVDTSDAVITHKLDTGNPHSVKAAQLPDLATGVAATPAVTANTAKTGITTTQSSAIVANTAKTGITPTQSSAIVANTAKTGITTTQSSAIVANTAKTGITPAQSSAIVANTAKVVITPTQSSAIVANTAKVGITPTQSSAIVANTAKTGITTLQASAISANTAKTGITPAQSSAIVANTAKTGITTTQASAIVANTAKTGITTAQSSAIVANTAKTGITTAQSSAIVANTAKVVITPAQSSAIVANTAKTGITPAQSSAIVANTAKTGITTTQASAISANTAKVGITTLQASAIVANTAKTGITTTQAANITEIINQIAPEMLTATPLVWAGSTTSPGTINIGDAPRGHRVVNNYYADSPYNATTKLWGIVITRNTNADPHPTTANQANWFHQDLYLTDGTKWTHFATNGGAWTPWQQVASTAYVDTGDASTLTSAKSYADNLAIEKVANKAAASAITPVAGMALYIQSSDGKGNVWQAATGAAVGTYTDNGGAYCGTVFIPTGGDGSTAWVRDYANTMTPEMFGAIGDGVIDDLTAFQQLFTSVPTNTNITMSNNYLIGGQVIAGNKNLFIDAKGSTLTFVGDTSGFSMWGAITKFTVDGGVYIGDNTNRDAKGSILAQIIFRFTDEPGPSNIRNVHINSVFIADANIGIKFAGTRGTVIVGPTEGNGRVECENCKVTFSTIQHSIGVVGGLGYGLQFSTARYGSSIGNTFRQCQRHELYMSEGNEYQSIGDTFYQHRYDVFDGHLLPATMLSRSQNMTVTSPRYYDCYGGCFGVDQDTNYGPCKNVNIINPTMYNCHELYSFIGPQNPAIDGAGPYNVRIEGFKIYHDINESVSCMNIYSAEGFYLSGEINTNVALAGVHRNISIEDNGAYLKDITIDLQMQDLTVSSVGIQIPPSVCTGNNIIDMSSSITNCNLPVEYLTTTSNGNIKGPRDEIYSVTFQPGGAAGVAPGSQTSGAITVPTAVLGTNTSVVVMPPEDTKGCQITGTLASLNRIDIYIYNGTNATAYFGTLPWAVKLVKI